MNKWERETNNLKYLEITIEILNSKNEKLIEEKRELQKKLDKIIF